MNLEQISTAQLVEELSKREAVEKITVKPYEEYQVIAGKHKVASDADPAVLLRIWD